MVVLSPLPPCFASAIAGLRWPLSGPDACPPLHYKSMEAMKLVRAAETTQQPNSHNSSKQSPSSVDLFQDIPGTVESLFSSDTCGDSNARHFGMVSVALILLGHGWTDECHNMILPLSWRDDIHHAYSPSVYSQMSPEARSFATYVHCLVHRKEAFNVGEFGMVGFQNANFWSNIVARSDHKSLPHAQLLSAVKRLAKESDAKDCPEVQEWYQQHGFSDTGDTAESQTIFFESRAVHELCALVLCCREEEHQESAPLSASFNRLQSFAERAVETELRILLAHTLTRAGFSIDGLGLLPEQESII